MTAQPRAPLVWMLGLVLVGIALDQATKVLAVAYLQPGQSINLVFDILQLRLVRNPGASFGVGGALTPVFSTLALVVLVAVAVWVVPKVRARIWVIGVGLGVAGVTGNLIDRLIRDPGPFNGEVIDFFSLKYFAVFNVADLLLTAAAIIIIVTAVFRKIDFSGEPLSSASDQAIEPAGEDG